jgi:hypothetical protein
VSLLRTSLSQCFVFLLFESIFVPEFELGNDFLLGIVDGLLGVADRVLGFLKTVEQLAVVSL